jgi:hypothetical protein
LFIAADSVPRRRGTSSTSVLPRRCAAL